MARKWLECSMITTSYACGLCKVLWFTGPACGLFDTWLPFYSLFKAPVGQVPNLCPRIADTLLLQTQLAHIRASIDPRGETAEILGDRNLRRLHECTRQGVNQIPGIRRLF